MKIKTDVAREPYYKLSDAVVQLVEAAQHLDDEKLYKLIETLDSVQTKIHKHLDDNYLWD